MCVLHTTQGRLRQFGDPVVILTIFILKVLKKIPAPLIATNIYVLVKYTSNGLNMTFTHIQIDIYLWTR